MNEIEQKVWEQHDRRLNEHELRFNHGTKDFTEIKDALRQLSERLNEGVSKTQQKLLEENKAIELAVHDLTHAVEMNTEKMNNKIDIVQDNLAKRISPLEDSNRRMNGIYIWGIVTGVVTGMVLWGTKSALDKFSRRFMTEDTTYLEHVRTLTTKTPKDGR